MKKQTDFSKLALEVIDIEANAVLNLKTKINNNFNEACNILLECKGRIVVSGIGKSGHIANKISATLSSTGSPSFFLHPSEAIHGDMGMLTKDDVVIIVSNSGTTSELLPLINPIKRLGLPLIALTSNPNSLLAKNATIWLDISVPQEACPLGLVPTASTTVTLVMGDALAIALLQARGFSKEDFAKTHPGGHLGKTLLLTVDEIMQTDELMPIVSPETTLKEALIEITAKKLGFAAIIDNDRQILGIFTDGDLRRALDSKTDILNTEIQHIMTKSCKTIVPNTLASEALKIMEQYKINALLIAEDDTLLGVINMHQLLQAGIV